MTPSSHRLESPLFPGRFEHLEGAIQVGGLAAAAAVLAAGLLLGLTPGAYLTGPAVLGYLSVGGHNQRAALLLRALCYVIGAALPLGALGLLLGVFGDVVL